MKNHFRILILCVIACWVTNPAFSQKALSENQTQPSLSRKATAAGCLPPSAFTDLDINNVRARILSGGDMWMDDSEGAHYFIPKNQSKAPLLIGAMWLGGLDENKSLGIAAQVYRGIGNEFWPGPLSNDGLASVSAPTCDYYNRLWVINKAEVEEFVAVFAENGGNLPPNYVVPACIREYPAHPYQNNGNLSPYLAPFYDNDGDLIYNYEKGDYPYYDFDYSLCPENYPCGYVGPRTMEGNGILSDQVLKGDMTVWWVFNDMGNDHTATNGEAVGIEIRAQAYAYATNDDLNNMTFYSYEIINRSTHTYRDMYYGQYIHPTLGYPYDNYVGCDVRRGLGYCYNGLETDGTGQEHEYGDQPPAVGIDFFQGPYMDADGLDNPAWDPAYPLTNCNEAINGSNFGNCIIDDERMGMRHFLEYCCSGSSQYAIYPPNFAYQYYDRLRAVWNDGQHLIYWGHGHPSAGGYGPECDFMFPDDSDPCNWGTRGIAVASPPFWNESSSGSSPDDRRFLISSGPFTLNPGGVNYITIGIPWARALNGGPWASVELLRTVDDKCQALFDHCFKILDGPNAPDLVIQELDRELILYLSNRKGVSNNYNEHPEDYCQEDYTILNGDSLYRFEGYQIFQIKNEEVTVNDLHNPDLARLAAQCDKKNGVCKIVNFIWSEDLDGSVPVMEVNGSDEGIVHSFRIFEDLFSTGNKRLVNHKRYYYLAIAYAYNNYKTYNPNDPFSLDGQKIPYKAGNRAATGMIRAVSAMPHIPSPANGGTIWHCEYGTQPRITRIEGNGNGGMEVDFTAETFSQIMSGSPYFAANPTYDYNKGPVNIKVVDPLNVPSGNFTLKIVPPASGKIDSSCWVLTNLDNGMTWNSEKIIDVANEQLLMELGLSINIVQPKYPGDLKGVDNGVISSSITFADNSKQWLSGVVDADFDPYQNWIRSGNEIDKYHPFINDYELLYVPVGTLQGTALDPSENYEKILGGTWAPYRMSSKYANGPAWDNNVAFVHLCKLENLYSIDLVITPDRSKWTRCPVIEQCEDADVALSEGNVMKFDLRAGQTDGVIGMGWFPGYAINVETGERLNMMYGEDSRLQSDNGRDMIWNPTTRYFTNTGVPVFGGKHWTYIFGHNGDHFNSNYGVRSDCPAYDGGEWVRSLLYPSSNPHHLAFKRFVYKDLMWVGCPIISDSNYQFYDPANMPCEVKIRIRMVRPYKRFYSTAATAITNPQNNNYPMYQFSTNALAPTTNDLQAAVGSLALINVVPNPYYAYSDYETDVYDKRVRITNLPEECTVTIYTINGVLIRQYSKNDPASYLDWDLKSHTGIQIAGGIYLIYVKVDGVGERVLKWFGSLRKEKINAY